MKYEEDEIATGHPTLALRSGGGAFYRASRLNRRKISDGGRARTFGGLWTPREEVIAVGLQEWVAPGERCCFQKAAPWNHSSLDENLVGRRGDLGT